MITLVYTLHKLRFCIKINTDIYINSGGEKKNYEKKPENPVLTRQYMLSKDYELYYYSDSHMANVDSHTHDYYEFYFFWKEPSLILLKSSSMT